MSGKSPLHIALKQLTRDIRALIELSSHEKESSWEQMMETVRRELGEELSHLEGSELVNKELIREIYDHLYILIRSLKVTQERFRKLAMRDLLTGLYNRNHFNETIAQDIKRAKRYHEQLSIIIIDIDNFKKINDTYGHLHGDGVIKECAAILKNSVRSSDFLCRYGGDEFVIVTPKAECRKNEELIGRIHKHLDEWNREYATFDYRLSFSIGCANWKEGRNLSDVLHEADLSMYEDKKRKKKG